MALDLWETLSISIMRVEYSVFPAGWSWGPQMGFCDELTYIVKGRGALRRTEETIPFTPGDMVLFRRGLRYSILQDENLPHGSFCVDFSLLGWRNIDLLNAFQLPDCIHLPKGRQREVIEIYKVMIKGFEDYSLTGILETKSAFLRLIALYLKIVEESPASRKIGSIPLPPEYGYPIDKVLAYIDQNLHRRIAMSDLAREAEMSRYHFSRVFRRAVGNSPAAYVRSRRFDLAKQFLLSTQKTISEIALNVGFIDPFHFSHAFHQQEGLSPSAFRTKYRGAGFQR